jgi:DNA polymerase-3 subunit alpha
MQQKKQKNQQVKLFQLQQKAYHIPVLNSHWVENFYDEIELLGFTIQNYFSLLRQAQGNIKEVLA